MKIEYKPIANVIKEAETYLNKSAPEYSEHERKMFIHGWVKSEYARLCLQIEKHNATEEAKEIINNS